jgi:hypothetical protein
MRKKEGSGLMGIFSEGHLPRNILATLAFCGFVLQWVLPLDPESDFLYMSSERGMPYEDPIENI